MYRNARFWRNEVEDNSGNVEFEFKPSWQDKIYQIEHEIRSLVETRKMRASKAIGRVFRVKDPDLINHLAKLWDGASFNVEMGNGIDLFDRAYRYVSSCMQGKGDYCHKAYTPNGVEIAAINHPSRGYTARALYLNDNYNRVYGEDHYLLEYFLKALGFNQTRFWLKSIPHENFYVREIYRYTKYVDITEPTGQIVKYRSDVSCEYDCRVIFDVTIDGDWCSRAYELLKPIRSLSFKITEWMNWYPYIDD